MEAARRSCRGSHGSRRRGWRTIHGVAAVDYVGSRLYPPLYQTLLRSRPRALRQVDVAPAQASGHPRPSPYLQVAVASAVRLATAVAKGVGVAAHVCMRPAVTTVEWSGRGSSVDVHQGCFHQTPSDTSSRGAWVPPLDGRPGTQQASPG